MAKKSDPAPPQTVEAPAGKKVVVDNRPLWKKKRFIIPVTLIAVVIAINALSGNNNESNQSGDSATTTSSSSSKSSADDEDSTSESASTKADTAEAGTRDNPLPLGEMHSRDVGLTGTGWDVSIDNVERVGLAPFASADVTGECIVVSGTATAREVSTEDGLSNIFSFPEVHVVVNGADLGIDDQLACDVQPAGYENYLTAVDMSVAEGGTVQWVDTFHSTETGAPIDWIAIEETVYEVPS